VLLTSRFSCSSRWPAFRPESLGLRQRRIRRSLQTRDRTQARAIRDVLFARLGRNTSEPRTFLQEKGA
jgi:hypothetical protein